MKDLIEVSGNGRYDGKTIPPSSLNSRLMPEMLGSASSSYRTRQVRINGGMLELAFLFNGF